MARIVFEDEGITEYDDGTEEVRFSAEEWDAMLKDPAYGYICQARKHRLSESDHRFIVSEGICPHCFADAEEFEGIYRDAYEQAIERGDDENGARAVASMAAAVYEHRGLLCRTMASGSLALYEPKGGLVVEIIREAVGGFDAFAHVPPMAEDDEIDSDERYARWVEEQGLDRAEAHSLTGSEVPDTWLGSAHGEALARGLDEHHYCGNPHECEDGPF